MGKRFANQRMGSLVVSSLKLLTPIERFKLLALTLGRLATQVLDVAGIAALGALVAILSSNPGQALGESFLFFDTTTLVTFSPTVMLAVVVAFFLAKTVSSLALLSALTSFLRKIESRLSSAIIRLTTSSGLESLRRHSVGDHIWIAGLSVHVGSSRVLYSISSLIAESGLFVSIFVVFVIVDWLAALVSVAYFALLAFVFQGAVSRRLEVLGEDLALNQKSVNNAVTDLVSSYRETTVLGRRENLLKGFENHRSRLAGNFASQRFIMGLPRSIVELALVIGIAAFSGWQLGFGEDQTGLVTVAVFLGGGLRLMSALLPIQNAIADIKSNGPQGLDAQAILLNQRRSHSGDSASYRSQNRQLNQELAAKVSVQARNMGFSHIETSEHVLQHVTFSITGPGLIAITGPSGGGKSTLLDLIAGLEVPTHGAVEINGVPATQFIASFPEQVAIVPQNPKLIGGSISQNVALGIQEELIDRKRVEEVLRNVDLWSYINKLSGGLDTSLDGLGDKLSGGQIQRIGVARALYSQPSLVLLDEPTSSLDRATERVITTVVNSLRARCLVIVAAHRVSTIRTANRAFEIENGFLTEKALMTRAKPR